MGLLMRLLRRSDGRRNGRWTVPFYVFGRRGSARQKVIVSGTNQTLTDVHFQLIKGYGISQVERRICQDSDSLFFPSFLLSLEKTVL